MPKNPFVSEFIFTSEQLKAMGCLVVETTRLELLIEGIIIVLCKMNEHTASVLIDSRLTIAPKIKMLSDLLQPLLSTEAEKESFKKISDDINDIIAKRNIVIHGKWSYALGKDIPVADAIATKKATKKTVRASELMSLARRFSDRYHDLMRWYVAYYEARKTLP